MPKITMKVPGYECLRCGHKWLARLAGRSEPKICPRCKSAYWNEPRHRKELTAPERAERSARLQTGARATRAKKDADPR